MTYNAGIVVSNTLGNFLGPLVMARSFMVGVIVYIVGSVISSILLLYIRWNMLHINHQRKDKCLGEKTDPSLDYTDRQDANFVYRL